MTQTTESYIVTIYIYVVVSSYFTQKYWSYIKLYCAQDTEIYFSEINYKCLEWNKHYNHLHISKNSRMPSCHTINHVTRKLRLNVFSSYETTEALSNLFSLSEVRF
jgi:hypothetical protein